VLFLGVWEQINNLDFNSHRIRWELEMTGRSEQLFPVSQIVDQSARGRSGLIASAGRYGGTFAHKDIAFEFGSWISPEFKLYLIKEFQRLKEDENRRLSLAWNLNRTLSKLNYRIHTDAVKTHLIPPEVTPAQAAITYATEADLLNVALFGHTARQWRDANPKLEGNVRDYASIEQLLVLANLEGMNAEFIHMGLPQGERLKRLNQIAIRQMQVLTASNLKALPGAKGSHRPRRRRPHRRRPVVPRHPERALQPHPSCVAGNFPQPESRPLRPEQGTFRRGALRGARRPRIFSRIKIGNARPLQSRVRRPSHAPHSGH
jgi:hypothetical protein